VGMGKWVQSNMLINSGESHCSHGDDVGKSILDAALREWGSGRSQRWFAYSIFTSYGADPTGATDSTQALLDENRDFPQTVWAVRFWCTWDYPINECQSVITVWTRNV
jgi:hypothetical protein